jgi:hypothetical protein
MTTALESARLETIAIATGNRNTLAEREAAAALKAHQPAYWTSHGYSNGLATSLLWKANHRRSMARALRDEEDFIATTRFSEADVLDWFIPLNAAAVREMQDLYEIAGTFRTADELRAREPGQFASAA